MCIQNFNLWCESFDFALKQTNKIISNNDKFRDHKNNISLSAAAMTFISYIYTSLNEIN